MGRAGLLSAMKMATFIAVVILSSPFQCLDIVNTAELM